MSHILGYLCSDPTISANLLRILEAEMSLLHPSASSGVGLGWIQDKYSLLRNHPRPPAGLASVPAMISDLPSRTVVAHIRDAGLAPLTAVNLAPFRFRQWIWASPGDLETPNVDSKIPDHISQNIHGNSQSEWVFHLVLTKLSQADLLENPERDLPGVAMAIAQVLKDLRSLGIEVTPILMATNKRIFGFSTAAELKFRTVAGMEIQEEALFAGHKPRTRIYPAFRAVILTTAPTVDEHWREVPADHVVWFDAQNTPHFEAI